VLATKKVGMQLVLLHTPYSFHQMSACHSPFPRMSDLNDACLVILDNMQWNVLLFMIKIFLCTWTIIVFVISIFYQVRQWLELLQLDLQKLEFANVWSPLGDSLWLGICGLSDCLTVKQLEGNASGLCDDQWHVVFVYQSHHSVSPVATATDKQSVDRYPVTWTKYIVQCIYSGKQNLANSQIIMLTSYQFV